MQQFSAAIEQAFERRLQQAQVPVALHPAYQKWLRFLLRAFLSPLAVKQKVHSTAPEYAGQHNSRPVYCQDLWPKLCCFHLDEVKLTKFRKAKTHNRAPRASHAAPTDSP